MAFDNVKIEYAPEDKLPRCPYCKTALPIIWCKTEGMGIKGEEKILMCPHCEAFLGYNAWKR
jgi:hypothetical protein